MRDDMLTELEKVINSRRRIYLLRHGEVSYFDPGGAPYQQAEVPLNGEGRKQARAAGEALSEAEIDLVITSGLPRTLQTAELALEQIGSSPKTEIIEPLREIMPGNAFKNTGKGTDLA
ncbi:MAG: phosphoglycerate mutase family protein, partial [Planctomycetota bacterium]|nr:phosphoglycerate mutase family protein [Planctomycetota bacterium]